MITHRTVTAAGDVILTRPDDTHRISALHRLGDRSGLSDVIRFRVRTPSEGTARRNFYRPGERGFERELKKRLDYWDKLRQRASGTGVK